MTVNIETFLRTEGLPESYRAQIHDHWQAIAIDIVTWRRAAGRPIVVGICGSQGSGKSTLAKLLHFLIEAESNLRVQVLSLDDLYLPRLARERLALEVHPLLKIRGVPGTHDVALGLRTIKALTDIRSNERVAMPAFDKAADDRIAPDQWNKVEPADIILFEGWFVGAGAQPTEMLETGINILERTEDASGRWRRYVNDQLAGPYQELFSRLDHLVYLKAPSFEVVRGWRGIQEAKLRATVSSSGHESGGSGLMDDGALDRFVLFYERLTRHLFATMPHYADITLILNGDQTVRGRVNNDAPYL